MQRLFAKKEKDVRQYLRNDRKVLRFYAVSELPYYPLGCKGEQKYVIHYYLSDDTLEVRELRSLEEPKGAGTFPKFLKRQKIPKGEAARPKSKIQLLFQYWITFSKYYLKFLTLVSKAFEVWKVFDKMNFFLSIEIF